MLIPAKKCCCKMLPQNKEDYGCILADKILYYTTRSEETHVKISPT